jgi:D-arabinose 1-dehydrogenase-like Zn-dependent alcohol dehydrogenase
MFPIVAGHEAAGKVVEVGSKVTSIKVGDNAGIGVMSDSCLDCEACECGDE